MRATSCTGFGSKKLRIFRDVARKMLLARSALECGGLPPLFLLRACSQFWSEICGLQNGQQAGLARAAASYRTPRRLRRRLGDAESQIVLRCLGARAYKKVLDKQLAIWHRDGPGIRFCRLLRLSRAADVGRRLNQSPAESAWEFGLGISARTDQRLDGFVSRRIKPFGESESISHLGV